MFVGISLFHMCLLRSLSPVTVALPARQEYIDLVTADDSALMLELQMAYQEKNDNFKITDITVIKACMQSHIQATKGCDGKLPATIGAMELEHAALEKQQYDLDINLIQSDVKKFRAYRQKNTDRQNAEYFHKLEWQQSVVDAGKKFGTKFVTDHCMFATVKEGAPGIFTRIQEFQTRAENELYLIKGASRVPPSSFSY